MSEAAAINRRDLILSEARRLFYEQGYQAASMRDLALRTDVTQAALYYHFPSKEAILFELLDTFTRKLIGILRAELSRERDPLENLKAALHAQIMLTRDHSHDIKLVFEDKKQLGGDFGERIRTQEGQIFRLYKTQIEMLQELGRVRPLSSTVLTFNAISMTGFVYQWYNADGSMTLEQVAADTISAVIEGFLPRTDM